jgi:hypothetical protein
MTGKRDELSTKARRDPGDAVPSGVAGASGEEPEGSEGAARDPGDTVPPGVAPLEPPEPSAEERRVLEMLRDLPNRS